MRIIGMMVCGPSEADRYLEGTLKELERLCDDVVVCGNNTDEKTEKMIKDYGFWFYRDDREWGKEQPNLKTDLLRRVGGLQPDWVIALDADERFAPEFTREEAEKLANGNEVGWYFMIVNLYNDTEHFVHDTKIQRFWNIRFFQYSKNHLQYQKTRLHCGLAPPIYYAQGWHAPFYVEHYGLMKAKDRQNKVERYAKYDPKARFKGKEYYDDLSRELKPMKFDKQGLLNKLKEASDCKPRNKTKYGKISLC